MYDQDEPDEHDMAVPTKRDTGKENQLLVPVSSSSTSPASTARTAWKDDQGRIQERGPHRRISDTQLQGRSHAMPCLTCVRSCGCVVFVSCWLRLCLCLCVVCCCLR